MKQNQETATHTADSTEPKVAQGCQTNQTKRMPRSCLVNARKSSRQVVLERPVFETARERRAEQEKISEQMAQVEEDVDLHQVN